MSNSGSIFQKRLQLAVKASAIEVQSEAQENHQYRSRTANLERSIDVEISDLAGKVYINPQKASYGAAVHRGSKAHWIYAKHRLNLRWFEGDKPIFAKRVWHPGYKGDPFLYNALKSKKSDIDNIFRRYTNDALEEVASDIQSGTYIWR